jgi:hypothetical protein
VGPRTNYYHWLLGTWAGTVLLVLFVSLLLALTGWAIPVATVHHTSQAEVAPNEFLRWLGVKVVVDVHHETVIAIPAWLIAAVVGVVAIAGVKIWRGFHRRRAEAEQVAMRNDVSPRPS